MELHYDSAYTYLRGGVIGENIIRQCCTYIDKNVEYLNRSRAGYMQEDPSRCLYNDVNQSFPTGLLTRVVQKLNKLYPGELKVIRTYPFCNEYKWELPDEAWPHQRALVEQILTKRRGMFKSPTGSGKTRSAAYLLKNFPTERCIFTVPTRDLMHQSQKALEEILGEPVGMVGDSKKKWQRVTVGVINSLSRAADQDPSQFRDVKVLIMDECHRAGAPYYVRFGSACINADIRIGLSATPWRNNGDDLVMEGVLGPLMYSVEETAMLALKVTTPIEYHYVEFNKQTIYPGAIKVRGRNGSISYAYNTPDGRPAQNDIIQHGIVNNEERNELIVTLGRAFLKNKNALPGVILVERIEHGLQIQKRFADLGLELPFVHGNTKNREEVFKNLCQHKLMIASSILKEGVDIPALGFAIIAGGGSSSSKIIQQVGRICRSYPGKTKAIAIDVKDSDCFLSRSAEARIAAIEGCHKGSTRLSNVEDLCQYLKTN